MQCSTCNGSGEICDRCEQALSGVSWMCPQCKKTFCSHIDMRSPSVEAHNHQVGDPMIKHGEP